MYIFGINLPLAELFFIMFILGIFVVPGLIIFYIIRITKSTKSDKITVEYTDDEAMVMLEFLIELDKKNGIKRKSDKRVVWDTIAMLEKQHPSIINNKNYEQDIKNARDRLASTVDDKRR